jgi:hypothetical protein
VDTLEEGMIHVTAGQHGTGCHVITVLRMAYNLKPMNCLSLKFSI